ncbi:MAG: hypothetical protein AAF530_22075 [Pseudomonadota bacterium]
MVQNIKANHEWIYGEPQLEDVLKDPIVHQVMLRDGVSPGSVLALAATARRHLADRLDQSSLATKTQAA